MLAISLIRTKSEVSPISNNLSLQFLPKCDFVDPLFRELESKLSMKDKHDFLAFLVIEELCPPEKGMSINGEAEA